VCRACYFAARRLIRDKKATWERLEERGLVNKSNAPSHAGNPLANAFFAKETDN
jgi:hypothetical protein